MRILQERLEHCPISPPAKAIRQEVLLLMNDMQKSQIAAMRADGAGYVKIAKALSLSENTVKSFCRRNNLTDTDAAHPALVLGNDEQAHFCLCCGNPVEQAAGRKEKKFCSDKCRMHWWNTHRDKVRRRNGRNIVCSCCGKTFEIHGGSGRKYCSHECYIADRFGGGCHE